jgi:hypothetical protein
MDTNCGPIKLDRADGSLATLSIEGQPDRAVALKRRETAELMAEELRRLDPDDTYASALRYGVDRLKSSWSAQVPRPAAAEGPEAKGERGEPKSDGRARLALPAPVEAAAKAPAAEAAAQAPVKQEPPALEPVRKAEVK